MVEKDTQKERKILGGILLCVSALAGVMAIVYLVKFMFFGNNFIGFMAAFAFAATMLFGALMGIGLNYTFQVPRGREEDKSQVIAGMIMMILGTVICASMQIILGIGEYIILPIVFYAQNYIMFMVCLFALKLYKKKY